MTRRILGAAFAASFASLLMSSSAMSAPPVEAFGKLEAIKDVHLSPDGKHFSALEPVNGRFAVVVFDLHPAPGSKPLIYQLPEGNAVGSAWVTDERLVCWFYQTKYVGGQSAQNLSEHTRLISVSITDTSKAFPLMEGSTAFLQNGGGTTRVAARSTDKPGVIYMPAWQAYGRGDTDTRLGNGRYRYNLFAVNVDTNHVDTVEHGFQDTVQWIVDEHGHAVARKDSTDSSETPQNTDTFLINDNGNWREAGSFTNYSGSIASLRGLTQDGGALAVEKIGNHDTWYLESLPLKAGAAPAELFSNPNYDVAAPIYDEWTGRVVGASYVDDKTEYQYFDPQLAHMQKRMEAALPGQTVELSSWDKDRKLFLITASDPHNPPGVFLFDTTNSHLDYLMGAYPTLQPTDLGDVKPYPYKARDGLDIHAYMTMPPGKAPKNLPMVVLPHGGPDDRDALGFDYWAQFLASRGYVVLQPNFRGSTGYGVKFRDAGFGQWGRKMQDDITDGVKKAIADGIADPKRICIVGASYGGYAALAGATFTPELYACAVSYAGIADVASILGQSRSAGADSSLMHFWETRVGVSYGDTKTLEAISPAFHAAQVRAPILLLHSTNDLTVSVIQSEREAKALNDAGKTVQFLKIDGDDHYLQHDDARLAVLRSIETFLGSTIGH